MDQFEFPPEILYLIFGFIPNSHGNWANVMRVSTLWLDIGRLVFNPAINPEESLLWACKNNKLTCIRFLLDDGRVDPNYDNGAALATVIEIGYIRAVNMLMSDPRLIPTEKIIEQAICDSVLLERVLKLNLNVEIPGGNDKALTESLKAKNTLSLMTLLSDKRTDPTANNNQLLVDACKQANEFVVDLLLKHPLVHQIPQEAINSAAIKGSPSIVKKITEKDPNMLLPQHIVVGMLDQYRDYPMIQYLSTVPLYAQWCRAVLPALRFQHFRRTLRKKGIHF